MASSNATLVRLLTIVTLIFGCFINSGYLETTLPWYENLPAVAMDYKVHIEPGKEDCYFQYVNPGATFYVSFQVLRGGDGMAGFAVRHPNGQIVHPYQWKANSEYQDQTSTGGYYAVCIDNQFSRFADKLVNLYLTVVRYDQWDKYTKEIEEINMNMENFTICRCVEDKNWEINECWEEKIMLVLPDGEILTKEKMLVIDELRSFEVYSRWLRDSITAGRWLNAHEDRSAGVKVFNGRCLLLCDSSNTGDYGLIIAEPKVGISDDTDESNSNNKVSISGRLRIYRGAASLSSERPLQGPPSALLSFYSDDLEPRIPAVAVSIATDILIYKNNKPFFKWSTPPTPSTALEEDIWRRLVSPDALETQSLKEQLSLLKTIPFSELSPRSQKLLILASDKTKDNLQDVEEFIGRYIHAEAPTKPAIIISLATLNKNSMNVDAVACLVVATENGHIYVLDPVAFTVLHQASSSTETNLAPVHITCSGQFDIDYKIITICRDESVWLLRRGWLEGRRLVAATLGGPSIECVTLGPENLVVIAGRDKVGVWSRKGKLIYSIPPNSKTSTISCLCLVPLPHLNTCLLAVGINTQIHLYQSRVLVDTIQLPDKPAAIKFGRLGQEDNVLVIVTKDGSLLFKILKRTAEFSTSLNTSNDGTPNISAIVNRPLPLPKRSKLFAEQAQRERNYAQNIHQIFQQGLIRLRLIAANNTVLALNTADQSVSDNVKHPVKLSAQVLGLGPKFTLTLSLENLSSDKSVSNLSVLLHSNVNKYRIEKPFIQVPMVPPELSYKVETSLTEIIDSTGLDDEENSIPIRVFVLIPGQAQPILAATINMPPTDPLAFLV